MREILYIRLSAGIPDLGSEAAAVEYALAPGEQPQTAVAQRAPLEQVLAQAAGRRIVLLVPGADLRLSSVSVPARQTAKVLQAAPYQLEDQLAEDIDTLHFALGPRQSDGSHPVAVVARERMEAWLAPFRARGLKPAAVYPETLCLPWEADAGWIGLIEPGQVTVRNGAFSGFCCAPDDLVEYLSLADPDRTHTLRLLIPAAMAADYSRIDWPLELRPGYATAIEALTRHLQAESNINLLQGAYSQNEDWERYWKPWRTAAVLAVAVIAFAALRQGLEIWRLSAEVKRQDAANVARFQQMFPSQTRIVDLQVQVDQQLQALQGGGQSGGLFGLLDVMTQAMKTAPGLKMQALQYRDGALFLSLTASDLQVVEKLREWFADQRGAALEVQSADAGTQSVQVRVKVTAR